MRKTKLILISLACIALGASLFLWFNRQELRQLARTGTAFYAKAFCSCHFVMNQSEKYCHEYAQSFMPTQTFELKQNTVRVGLLGIESKAHFLGKRKGCLLQKE